MTPAALITRWRGLADNLRLDAALVSDPVAKAKADATARVYRRCARELRDVVALAATPIDPPATLHPTPGPSQ